jgi:hypothetical protein
MSFDGWMAEQESGRRSEVRTVMGEGNEVVRRTLGPILPEFFSETFRLRFVCHFALSCTDFINIGWNCTTWTSAAFVLILDIAWQPATASAGQTFRRTILGR